MTDHDTPVCILQERAYSDGWRDYAIWQDRTGQVVFSLQRFYRKGWTDHERRDQRQAMYARRESVK